jgi:hypothetical protein
MNLNPPLIQGPITIGPALSNADEIPSLRWHVYIYDYKNFVVGTGWGATKGEAESNARLFASAQELLRAFVVVENIATREGWNTPLYDKEFGDALRDARVAIRNAGGVL